MAAWSTGREGAGAQTSMGLSAWGHGQGAWRVPSQESSIPGQAPCPGMVLGVPSRFVKSPAGVTLSWGSLPTPHLFLHGALGRAHSSCQHPPFPSCLPTIWSYRLPQTSTRVILGRRPLWGSRGCAGCTQSDGTPRPALAAGPGRVVPPWVGRGGFPARRHACAGG